MSTSLLNRREAVAALLSIGGAGLLSACGDAGEPAAKPAASTAYADGTNYFSASEMALIGALADTIIPATDTPGAVEAGVPAVLQGLASDWGDDNFRRYWREGLERIGGRLRAEAGRDFAELSPARRESLLAKLDAEAFAPAPETDITGDEDQTAYGDATEDSPPEEPAVDPEVVEAGLRNAFYRTFKNTAASAYYMSEAGASEELAYEAVPGEWIADAPISQYPKTWAT